MVKVAVAGGAQGLGSAIVKGIESRGVHECFILSRTPRQDDPRYIVVDYTDIDDMKNTLESNDIHTVISVLSMENGGGESQMNLIEAAERSTSTVRFMPSEFGMVYKEKHLTALPTYTYKLKAGERLSQTSLEYTHFSNSMYMDYFIAPRVATPLTSAVPVWIDLQNAFAAIPGDGNAVISMTHTSDIARFVAAILDLAQWEKRYHLIGDRCSVSEMVSIAEEVTGVSFERRFDDKEGLLGGKCTMLPVHKALLPTGMGEEVMMAMIAASGVRVVDGEMDLDVDLSVNRLFPELKTRTFRDAVQIWKEGEN